MGNRDELTIDDLLADAAAAKAPKGVSKPRSSGDKVDLYMNISTCKLHTSAGIVWPRQEVVLPCKEAEAYGVDKLVSRT